MARKGKKRSEESAPAGAPEWITTFVDMISLLVTFFILLLTFSSLDKKHVLRLPSLFMEDDGALQSLQGDSFVEAPDADWMTSSHPLEGSRTRHSRPPEELVGTLEEMGQKESEDHVAIDLNSIADGLLVAFDDLASFRPGSATPSDGLRTCLAELADTLQHYPYRLVVTGHTDDRVGVPWPSAEALGLARAKTAAELIARAGVSAEQIQIATRGADAPRATNDDPLGRQRNRRVDVRIVSLSKTLARNYELLQLREEER